jgi:hypothetical protein
MFDQQQLPSFCASAVDSVLKKPRVRREKTERALEQDERADGLISKRRPPAKRIRFDAKLHKLIVRDDVEMQLAVPLVGRNSFCPALSETAQID